MAILVTGAAGFIGAHVCRHLLARGQAVVGIDNLNTYYDVSLKHARLQWIGSSDTSGRFKFIQADFSDDVQLEEQLATVDVEAIVHLGAQAGVRYSIEKPREYAKSNLLGHLNILELARHRRVHHLVYASSSSVYGSNKTLPFRVTDRVDLPVSLYAATKRADELMSESYAHLYRIPQTGLRFFTVYGPWGRPDMAAWLFTDAIMNGRPIKVFNNGDLMRDFTYIDDIVAGIISVLDQPPVDNGGEKAGGSMSPHAVYNIGNNKPEQLGHLISVIEKACGKEALIQYQSMQPGDVYATFADLTEISRDLGFKPKTSIEEGVKSFVDWFKSYQLL